MEGVKTTIVSEGISDKFMIGLDKVSTAVGTTFGPYGKNVAINYKYNDPKITKDGISVLREINLEDPIENIACAIVKQASNRTATQAGDGTSSTTILTSLLYSSILKQNVGNINPLKLKYYLDSELLSMEKWIESKGKPVESVNDIKNISLISSNGDVEITELVVEAYDKIGKDGIVSVFKTQNKYNKIDVVDGIKLDRSFIHPAFNTNIGTESYTDVALLLTDLNIMTQEDCLRIISLYQKISKPLVIICNDIADVAVEILAHNKIVNKFPINVIRAPFIADARKNAIKDIAITTGATAMMTDLGWELSKMNPSLLGSCQKIEITSKETNIIGRNGDPAKIKAEIERYEALIADDIDGLAANYRKRLAYFNSGAAVIYLGGSNETEIDEKADRLDDALRAVKCSMDKGIVKGGGFMYYEICNHYEFTEGEVIKQIFTEAFMNLIATLHKNNYHYKNPKSYFESLDSNIVDPLTVLLSTVRNSLGAATILYTTDCVVLKKED